MSRLHDVQKAKISVEIDFAERILASMLSSIGPKSFGIALNNASCHGKCFSDCYWQDNDEAVLDDNDKFLGKWFEGIEKLLDACKH